MDDVTVMSKPKAGCSSWFRSAVSRYLLADSTRSKTPAFAKESSSALRKASLATRETHSGLFPAACYIGYGNGVFQSGGRCALGGVDAHVADRCGRGAVQPARPAAPCWLPSEGFFSSCCAFWWWMSPDRVVFTPSAVTVPPLLLGAAQREERRPKESCRRQRSLCRCWQLHPTGQ